MITQTDLKLAFKSVFRQGPRSLMPLLIISLAALVIIIIGGFYQYMFRSLEKSVIESQGHVWVNFKSAGGPGLSPAIYTELAGLDTIQVVAPRANISGVAGYGDKSSLFSGQAVDPEARMKLAGQTAGTDNTADPGAHLGIALARGLGVSSGDWINGITGDNGFSAKVGEAIQTESREKDAFYLELPFQTLGGMNYEMISSLHFRLKNVSALQETKKNILNVFNQNRITGLEVTDYTSPEGYVSSVKTVYYNNLVFIMLVLSITMFFGISSAFTLSITERTAELGTMKSCGANQGHITKLFQLESLMLSVCGFIAGFALAVGTGIIINAFGGIKIPPPPTVTSTLHIGFVFHWSWPLYAFAIIILIGQLSSFLVTRRLCRLNILELLRIT